MGGGGNPTVATGVGGGSETLLGPLCLWILNHDIQLSTSREPIDVTSMVQETVEITVQKVTKITMSAD